MSQSFFSLFTSLRMQVKSQKVDSFGVSGWVLAQIGRSIHTNSPQQELVTRSTSGLAIGEILRGG
jgi:hypothetical protein